MSDARNSNLRSAAIPLAADVQPYVTAVSYWSGGVSVELTRAGLDYGRTEGGAHHLARFVRSLDGWTGRRDQPDVADEIKAHCVAWRWLPPLRGRANPVDLEFDMDWPQNLVLSATSVLRRCIRRHRPR